jgi:hypothetical protein
MLELVVHILTTVTKRVKIYQKWLNESAILLAVVNTQRNNKCLYIEKIFLSIQPQSASKQEV